MNLERNGLIEFRGNDVTVVGPDIQVGQTVPDFRAVTSDWSLVNVIKSTRNHVRILGSLPSLNTSVCDQETRRFNESASALHEDIVILMVSMDLPFMQNEWCAAAGVERVRMFSDHKLAEFGEKYGVLLKEPRINRRAIFVIDRDDIVVYAQYMPALGVEPDYLEVLDAARQAL